MVGQYHSKNHHCKLKRSLWIKGYMDGDEGCMLYVYIFGSADGFLQSTQYIALIPHILLAYIH
jgi:hypothetical protein